VTSALQAHSTEARAWYNVARHGDTLRLAVGGAWTMSEARRLDATLRGFDASGSRYVEIDCGELDRIDTTGAWLLLRTKRILESHGISVRPVNVRPEYRALVHTIDHECRAPPVELPRRHSFDAHLERIGRGLCHALHQGYELVGFFGHVVFETIATVLQPRRLRLAALVHQMEETGLNALPIVGLLSFLVGVVFGIGWTPCVGPFLAAALTLAAVSSHAAAGALLLGVYSIGLGMPFVITALLWASLPQLPRRLSRLARPVTLAGGVVTAALGILLATGAYTHLTSYLAQLSTPS